MLRINQSILNAKTICWIQHTKRNRSKKEKKKEKKNDDEDGKTLLKLINNAVYEKWWKT